MQRFSRRHLLLAGAALPWVGLALAAQASAPVCALQQQLANLERHAKGRLGLTLIDTGRGQVRQYRADERFPLCSTFKFMLVAAVLHKSMVRADLLDEHIAYGEADLLSYAPIARKHLGQGMSVAQLCAAALQYSDNTAANLLIRVLGGPDLINHFARSLGDQVFRLDRLEPDLNSAIPGDARDTTTPAAIALSMQKIVLGKALAAPQRQQIIDWLRGNTTGEASIRAGTPEGWVIGDKTGSGDYGTSNDIAVLWSPQRASLVLAIYFTQHARDAAPRRDVLAAATRVVLQQPS